jgi:hypothetical protein
MGTNSHLFVMVDRTSLMKAGRLQKTTAPRKDAMKEQKIRSVLHNGS